MRSTRLLGLLLLSACATPTKPAPPSTATTHHVGARSPTSEPTLLGAEQKRRDGALRPTADAILGAHNNGSAHLTRSGTLVFLSNRDGLPQLYVADAAHPDAPAKRLPTPKERVAQAVLSPDDRTVLFASDVAADGNFHIFSIRIDGTALTDLTPNEKLHRNAPIVARLQPDRFAYSAHATSDEKTRVFVQRLDAGPAREVYADARGGELADVSPDGRRGLFTRFNSDQDSVVFEVDLATGRSKRIFPPERSPTHAIGVYSTSGDRVLVTTQAEGRPAELLSIDPKRGAIVERYQENLLPNGAIERVVVSPTGNRLAIVIDGGNHDELRILDARTLHLLRTIETPPGALSATEFTRDGTRLTVTQTLPNAPGDVFVVDVESGAITALRKEERAGLSSMAPITASIENISTADGFTLPTNLYLPAQRPGKIPTIVLIHGGPSSSATARWNPDVRFFTSLGYAIVEPNIRGSTGFGVAFEKADNKEKRADALKDVATINQWARSQSWCDGDRIIIMGTSYGGYMTLLALARQPSLWRAGVDLSGMSDLRTMEKLEDQAIRVYDETEFGILGKEDELLFEWSPLKYVDAIAAPLFVYQGVNDPVTPQNEADQIVQALRKRNVSVEYMLVANERHGIVRRENRAEFLARSARFLEQHLAHSNH
jgi:dipeptidyl aminopeptidase/acylaminoacyl peptidase